MKPNIEFESNKIQGSVQEMSQLGSGNDLYC